MRGLAWNNEIPWMLISGSWDSIIKIWDIRNATCVHTLSDHNADIYGITSSSDRPFIVVTCSRDTTLRFWSIEEPVFPIIVICHSNIGQNTYGS